MNRDSRLVDSQGDIPRESEFDEYAADYRGGGENPIKRLVGCGPADFIEVKVEWLLRELSRSGWAWATAQGAPRILDYGCGTGLFLKVLRRLGFRGRLEGADVSAAMLREAAARWRGDDPPGFSKIDGARAPYPDDYFDAIVMSGVLHHVAMRDRGGVYRDLVRLLKCGGRVYVFEHNPRNPLTRYVVRRTPIDRNAVLLRAREVREGLTAADIDDVRTAYLMFVPPRFRALRKCERFLPWLGLGGQYVVSGRKPGSATETMPAPGRN